MTYYYILALHIIFIVTWFAGLFYIVRLFVYHTEANSLKEPDRGILQNQYRIMMRRLWYGITWPSMIATLVFGPWLVVLNPALLSQAYFIVKLCFVGGLVLYHVQCHAIYLELRKNIFRRSSFALRLWNEVATVFLVAIVFIIVLKNNEGFIWGLLGLIIFSAALFGAAYLYRRSRENGRKNKDGDQ
ncbi:MAG: CopD family protein [Bacteroidota bacterium]